MNARQIVMWANQQFPKRDYLSDSAVRHNRRALIRSICYLRSGDESKWILDQKKTRKE